MLGTLVNASFMQGLLQINYLKNFPLPVNYISCLHLHLVIPVFEVHCLAPSSPECLPVRSQKSPDGLLPCLRTGKTNSRICSHFWTKCVRRTLQMINCRIWRYNCPFWILSPGKLQS